MQGVSLFHYSTLIQEHHHFKAELLTILIKFIAIVPLPAQMKAALWTGLNNAPPNMSHRGPIIMIEIVVTATASANSPSPLISDNVSAACVIDSLSRWVVARSAHTYAQLNLEVDEQLTLQRNQVRPYEQCKSMRNMSCSICINS